jgi:hypothetical protein
MVTSIDYEEGNSLSYKAVTLSDIFSKKEYTFDSGDFPTDWVRMLETYISFGLGTGFMCSSSVDHFFFDGADELYESGMIVRNGDTMELVYEWDWETQGTRIYTNKGEFLTYEQFADKYLKNEHK